jgi:hypothetical protein
LQRDAFLSVVCKSLYRSAIQFDFTLEAGRHPLASDTTGLL